MIDGIYLSRFALLTVGTFIVSLLVTAIGPTGGIQLAVVAWSVPGPMTIPLHAGISAISAGLRAHHLRRYINWRYVTTFIPGSVLASLAVMPAVSRIPANLFEELIGAFLVISAFQTQIRGRVTSVTRFSGAIITSIISGALTVFVGATGQLLFAMMAPRFSDRHSLVATHSMCLAVQHASKIVIFGVFGLLVFRYPVLLVSVISASWAGTFVGGRVLAKASESVFRKLMSAVMLVSGVALIVRVAMQH